MFLSMLFVMLGMSDAALPSKKCAGVIDCKSLGPFDMPASGPELRIDSISMTTVFSSSKKESVNRLFFAGDVLGFLRMPPTIRQNVEHEVALFPIQFLRGLQNFPKIRCCNPVRVIFEPLGYRSLLQ